MPYCHFDNFFFFFKRSKRNSSYIYIYIYIYIFIYILEISPVPQDTISSVSSAGVLGVVGVVDRIAIALGITIGEVRGAEEGIQPLITLVLIMLEYSKLKGLFISPFITYPEKESYLSLIVVVL